MGHFEALFVTLYHISAFLVVELTQAIDDFVLTWHINLVQRLLHLGFKFNIFYLALSYPGIFWINQELKILTFILKLPKSLFPFDLTAISLFFSLDLIMMQLIILFRQFLIFFL